jgi:hypothetical protein
MYHWVRYAERFRLGQGTTRWLLVSLNTLFFISLSIFISGCSLMLGSWWGGDACKYAKPPEISDLEVKQKRVNYGIVELQMGFNFFDLDADVDLDSEVHFEIQKANPLEWCSLSGTLSSDGKPIDLQRNPGAGASGKIMVRADKVEIYPSDRVCTAEVTVYIKRDGCGLSSPPLKKLVVLEAHIYR